MDEADLKKKKSDVKTTLFLCFAFVAVTFSDERGILLVGRWVCLPFYSFIQTPSPANKGSSQRRLVWWISSQPQLEVKRVPPPPPPLWQVLLWAYISRASQSDMI